MNAEEIFLKAVEIPIPAQRREYLDSIFAAAPEIRDEVEALLLAHEQAGSFLKSPWVLPTGFFELEPIVDLYQPGKYLGPFQLLQVIGRGGMGIVYRAQQTEPVKRLVALKIIRPGISTRSVIQRFETERQALAIMDHPNIARVIDAGSTETGQPYFVMELIAGIPITDYCDQARLTPRQRLELMIPVCEAIQHAHQKGIIHRDIKPSNVLVAEFDGRPVPKIIDFGVAKAVGNPLTDQSTLTDFGAVVGTLEYMSPEQAGLNQQDIDTRSDIYSLGVLIYELLTGATPIDRDRFKATAMAELYRVIREEDPLCPSARISTADKAPSIAANRNTEPARLSGLMRGDLDWIAMKALEKDRTRRYQTVQELADDLQHFLVDEPVSAGPPSRRYRARKFLRRNRATVISATLLLAALLAGIIGTSVGMLRARTARRETEIALLDVKQERDEKSKALVAEQAARAAANESSDRAVIALQTLTDETVDRILESQPTLSTENRQFIDSIVSQLEEFTNTTHSSVRARVVQADGLNRIGNLKARLGDYGGAVATLKHAVESWDSLIAEVNSKPEYRRGRADALSNLGNNLAQLENFEEAETAHRMAIDEHVVLAAEFPENQSYQTDVANCRNSFGVMLKDRNRNAETMEQYELAIKIYQSVLAQHPDNIAAAVDLTNVQNNYAIELFIAGKPEASIVAFQDLIAIREKIAAREQATPDDRFNLAMTYLNLAEVLTQSKRNDQLLETLTRAAAISGRIVDEFPGVVYYRDGHVNLLEQLGAAYATNTQYEQRIAVDQQRLRLLQQLAREFPDRFDYQAEVGRCYNDLAFTLLRTKNLPMAEENFRLARATIENVLPLDATNVEVHFQLCNNYVGLARLLKQRGELADAVAEFRRGLEKCAARPKASPLEPNYLSLIAAIDKHIADCESKLKSAAD